MKIKTENYVCSICGKRNVKLWRPYMDTSPLICAECAEKRQESREYEEKIFGARKPMDGIQESLLEKSFHYQNGK